MQKYRKIPTIPMLSLQSCIVMKRQTLQSGLGLINVINLGRAPAGSVLTNSAHLGLDPI